MMLGIAIAGQSSAAHSTARLPQLVGLGFPPGHGPQRPAQSSDRLADLSLPCILGHHLPRGQRPLLSTGVLLPLSCRSGEQFPGRTKGHLVQLDRRLHVGGAQLHEGSPDKRELLERMEYLVDGRYIGIARFAAFHPVSAAPASASSMCPSREAGG